MENDEVGGRDARLVNWSHEVIILAMFIRCVFCLILVSGQLAGAATVQLKDKAAVTGKILAEKRDQIVVDIGFTTLVIPRNQVVKILETKSIQSAPKITPITAVQTAPVETKGAFFRTESKPPPERSVRELVNQLGEAVVQVRTPGGLGSGFIVNEEGFLITNFHVIEGETQISVEVYHQKNGELDRHSYKQVRIVAINKFQDLALLKIDDKDAPKFARVSLGDSEVPQF